MLTEKEIIELIDKEIPSGPSKLNACFESDAEKLKFGFEQLLFSIDEFSGEDLFSDREPYTLGWNIAAGSVSDILATGGEPLYYAHALSVTQKWDEGYIKMFCHGLRDVLNGYGMTFIGGDLGLSKNFRCTASVIGRTNDEQLTRRGASAGDLIYITGEVGAGNFNAALNLFGSKMEALGLPLDPNEKFNLRAKEAAVLRKYATSCIDTSDGAFNALNTVSDINKIGYTVGDLPYIKKGEKLAGIVDLPVILLFLCECGEYELLFTVNPDDEAEFLGDAKKSGVSFERIGEVKAGVDERTYKRGDREIDLFGLNLRARSFETTKDYMETMIKWASENTEL